VFRLLFSLILVLATPVSAQDGLRVLTMSATGQVAVAPDMATVSVGVEVEAPTADRALRLNSARMKEVLALLGERGIADKDLQTVQFDVHPQWNNQKTSYDQPLEITGFIATNVVQVRIRQLDLLGPVLDALTKSGANRIQGVRFSVTNPGPYLDQARAAAVHEAIRKAGIYADAAGVTLGAILSIAEDSQTNAPMFRTAAAMADAVPIAEGEVTITASATLRFAFE